MKTPKIVHHPLFGIDVAQSFDDGYVNVTALSNAYRAQTGKRRQPNDWLRLERTKEMMEHLSKTTAIPVDKLYRTVEGRSGGTYLHPRLSVRFAIWLSDEFGFAVEQFIAEWSKDFTAFMQARSHSKGVRYEAMQAVQQAGFDHRHHYINATQVVYRSLFGMSAKDLKKERGIDENGSIRDALARHELIAVEALEERLIRELKTGSYASFSDFYAAAKEIGQSMKSALL